MTNNDFKKILDEALIPIKEEQARLRDIIEDRILPSVTYIETTVKSYADRYVTNEDHIQRLVRD